MKHLRRPTTQRWLTGAAAGLFSITASERLLGAPWLSPANDGAQFQPAHARFGFAYDHILGTSLDVRLATTSPRDARECERRMLAEIGRLEKILSLYRPDSEISRVKAGAPVESPELAEILRAYAQWSARTGGALSVNLDGVRALWREAARAGREPDPAALTAAFAAPRALNVDALGKAYIVDRTVAIARELVPAGLLDIGGDLRAWGGAAWMIGVANPQDPADNAALLVEFPLRDAAVATSGSYARSFTIGDRRYSHLIDPRTLRPAGSGLAATVVAPDCVTANALSTAAAVLGAADGARLARTYGLDHLIVAATHDGAGSGSAIGAGSLPVMFMTDTPTIAPASGAAWPAGFHVAVRVSLKAPGAFFMSKRPYVAVWVEDSEEKLVRTLAVWGNGRYQQDLTRWWRMPGNNRAAARAVTRATRAPGDYTVTWDGRDDHGASVPQGDYKIFVEINREHGHHVWETTDVSCRGEPDEVELSETAESESGPVHYGPKSSP